VLIGLLVLVGSLFGIAALQLMVAAGIVALLFAAIRSDKNIKISSLLPVTFLQISTASIVTVSNTNLFWIFLKIGSVLYGSGYVLFAFLDTELVVTGLLSRQQLIDAIAVGQVTPGPVFSSVTFVGYQINGFTGAIISTIAIFIPSFIFVALLNPLVKKMRNSQSFSIFLDAVNVASVAVIIAVCYEMGKEVITDWRTLLIAILSIGITFGYKKMNSAFVVLSGSLVGYLLSLF